MDYNDLTEEQKAKIAGKKPEEILALVQEEGYELSDDDLEHVSGGWGSSDSEYITCPYCSSSNVTVQPISSGYVGEECHCNNCGEVWSNM